MTLKFIKPVSITDAEFVSSTRAENDYAAWSAVTTYALGDRAISTTTHRIYESVQAGNLNHDPTTDDGTWWVDVGPTNRWAMFDQAVGSVTSQATPLTVVVDPGLIDSLALLDIAGTEVQITMTDGAGGPTVYDQTFDISDTAVLFDWYMYFFDPIVPRTTLIVDDLPPYTSGRVTIDITAAVTAECGTAAFGTMIPIGLVRHGAGIGIIDYSRKETSEFGITSVTERGYSKRFDVQFVLDDGMVDYVARKLAEIRATPVVWVGSEQYESLIAFGWVRDWGINIAYPSHSEASMTIEGLST